LQIQARIGDGDPGNRKDILGKWGMSFHDKWYRLEWFKAGDGAQR